MAVDEKLLKEIRALLPSSPGVRELSTAQAAEVVQRIRRGFVREGNNTWWWESLSSESVTLPYGDSDGLQWLRRLVPSREVVRLVVTDDEAGPWPVFEGEAQALRSILRELRFFEYLVTGARGDWVIFDTHHNTLVVAGALLEQARALVGLPDGDNG